MKNKLFIVGVKSLIIVISIMSFNLVEANGKGVSEYSVLIVTGQNNHYWKNSTPIFKKILDDAGIFKVDVAQSPAKGEDMSGFNPKFSDYDVIVLDYNGDMWNVATQKNFVDYVSSGGGVVVIHAADNSFGEWEEYNKIIGLGGWGDRDEKSGPYVYWKDGEPYRDYSEGRGGSHGKQRKILVTTRDQNHPIMKGMPDKWRHAKDELYDRLRGPAENMHILATAYADEKSNGSGREEPVLFTIKYGKGRIFHTVLGHVGEKQVVAVQGSGFVITLQRGTEWAASGKVLQALPEKLPGKRNPRMLSQYGFISE